MGFNVACFRLSVSGDDHQTMWVGNKQDQRQAGYPRKKGQWSHIMIESTLSNKRGLAAKKGGQVGSGREGGVVSFPCPLHFLYQTLLVACLPSFLIFPTDQEPGTGQVLCKLLDHDL